MNRTVAPCLPDLARKGNQGGCPTGLEAAANRVSRAAEGKAHTAPARGWWLRERRMYSERAGARPGHRHWSAVSLAVGGWSQRARRAGPWQSGEAPWASPADVPLLGMRAGVLKRRSVLMGAVLAKKGVRSAQEGCTATTNQSSGSDLVKPRSGREISGAGREAAVADRSVLQDHQGPVRAGTLRSTQQAGKRPHAGRRGQPRTFCPRRALFAQETRCAAVVVPVRAGLPALTFTRPGPPGQVPRNLGRLGRSGQNHTVLVRTGSPPPCTPT